MFVFLERGQGEIVPILFPSFSGVFQQWPNAIPSFQTSSKWGWKN